MAIQVLSPEVDFTLVGDGTASTVTLNLLDAPLNLPYSSNLPSGVVVISTGTNPPATATLNGRKLTLSFSFALPTTQNFLCRVQFLFDGV